MDKTLWYALDIAASPATVDAIEFALNELDALGTEVIDFPKQTRESFTVTGYFSALPETDNLHAALEYAFHVHGVSETEELKTSVREIENADWLAEWKRHWKPTEIGRFIVAAPWHDVDETDKIVIRIEPNMAFGTGTHETTQLCLKAIDEHYTPGESFLDVGTGTGILAIAAAKRFATEDTEIKGGNTSLRGSRRSISERGAGSECALPIYAIDNDPDSIKIARENVGLNGVAGLIEFQTGTLTAKTPHFDFICANLTLDVILPILPLLIEKTDRVLVMSGILAEQEPQITDALRENGIEVPEIMLSGEWIAVTIRKS